MNTCHELSPLHWNPVERKPKPKLLSGGPLSAAVRKTQERGKFCAQLQRHEHQITVTLHRQAAASITGDTRRSQQRTSRRGTDTEGVLLPPGPRHLFTPHLAGTEARRSTTDRSGAWAGSESRVVGTDGLTRWAVRPAIRPGAFPLPQLRSLGKGGLIST